MCSHFQVIDSNMPVWASNGLDMAKYKSTIGNNFACENHLAVRLGRGFMLKHHVHVGVMGKKSIKV